MESPRHGNVDDQNYGISDEVWKELKYQKVEPREHNPDANTNYGKPESDI
ncbi:MAG: hypothetical protein SCALA701_32090 [Candidatus Scalindua sp.]|nr:MAG: hypothetical protein SCALA701_32090 [Candidatus Scalindua sp.]